MASWKITKVIRRIDLDPQKVGDPACATSMRSALRIVNHDYVRLPRISWAQAREFLLEDEEMMESYQKANGNEFALIDDSQEMRRGSFDELSGIDIGVVSVVACLRALGASTITSCNGGWPFSPHHEDYPLVAFYAPRTTLQKILVVATEQKLGLSNTEPAAAMLYAASIPQMILCARRLFDEYAPAKYR